MSHNWAQVFILEGWDLNKMMRIPILKGLSPFHQNVGTRGMEDDILSKDVAIRIKFES